MSDDQLIATLKAAARQDTPPQELGARVLEHVAYRARLVAPLREERRRLWRRALGGVVTVGIAAGFWLWVRLPEPAPRILAEHPGAASERASRAAASATVSAPPVVDPCRGSVVAPGKAPLVDDFEDGDDVLAPVEQRAGFWRWARETDAPGTAPALLPVPRPDASARNRLALHTKGGQLYDWGATIEVSFRPPCYDATAYQGLALAARGPGRIYVSLREVDVIPAFEGGICQADCYNSHVAKLELGRDWRSYEVRWADLRQRGIGRPPLDPSRLHSIAIMIRPEDTPYDVWLDDVRFVPREP
ncbi:MAG TPA: hypothetical protein VHP33_40920 [Polyangiaceae bacterium]|nr:hypothetical protein [Polyangiaceae bacterium]